MAQKIKFRLTAAKVGASVALLALVGGVADRLRSGPSEARLTSASAQRNALGTLPQKIRQDVVQLEQKVNNLDSTLSALQQKVSTQKAKIHDLTFTVAKVKVAEATLGDDVGKLSAKVVSLLSKGFLTAAAAKNEFIQGRGGVVSAATRALADGSVRKLLTSPDGSLIVSLVVNGDGLLSVQIDNTTGLLVPAVMTFDNGAPAALNLVPGNKNFIRLGGPSAAHHLQLQTWGDGTSQTAQTLVLSSEPSPSNSNESQVVAQMLIGLL